MHIAFICTANMCRSVMAHAILETITKTEGLDITVSSGGTMNLGSSPPANDAWLTCIQHNTPISKMESTYVGNLDLDAIDLFFVMEEKHRTSLMAMHGIEESRIQLFEGIARQARITWPADGRYPDAHFDHAFGRGLEIGSISVPADYDRCSDHRPVVVDVVVEAGR